jgi:RNA polymerase sigma-70 factor, ECF subfamily
LIDQELTWVSEALKGDEEAFSHLVETYQSPVYNLCYRMLGDAVDAEDAAQETFLRAYKNIKRYDCQRSFSTWLLSIAAHHCIDQIRKRRYTTLSYDETPQLDPPDLHPGPEGALVINEDQAKVKALLARLNPQDRAAIIMRYWYEFSYEEIGEALSMTVSAVKSRLHRARIELAQLWMQQGSGLSAVPVERKRHESPAF